MRAISLSVMGRFMNCGHRLAVAIASVDRAVDRMVTGRAQAFWCGIGSDDGWMMVCGSI